MKKYGKMAMLLRAIVVCAISALLVLGATWVEKNVRQNPADSSKTGVGTGFGGEVTATLTLGKDGSITDVVIDAPNETPEIGGAAIEELRSQILAAQSADIDGVSGASLTSGAVRDAVAQALGVEVAAETETAEEPTEAATGAAEETTEAATEAAEGTTEAATEAAEGTTEAVAETGADVLTGTGDGFGGKVTATLTLADGVITDCKLEAPDETPTIGGAALEELAAQVVAANGAEIDGVSGASLTTAGVKAAVAAALASTDAEEAGDTATAEATAFTPGTYTGTSTGFGGEVTVTLTVTEDDITEVEITGDKETVNIGTFAVELLDDEIEEANTCKVDALTGATVTSNAIKRAAADALTQAGADVNALPSAEKVEIATEDKATETIDKQIVIVGAGGAGMTAAIKAKQAGADVLIVEKMPYAGGNTTKATGGMNAAGTHYQAEQGIEDSVEQFVEDTMTGGHDLNDKALVTKMAEESAACIDWLDSIGAPLPKLSFSGGATNSRIHAPEDGSGVGAYLVTAFLKQLDELGIEVMYNTTAKEIIMDGDKAAGIVAEGTDTVYTINADAVILATGGFGANNDMIVSYREDLDGTVTTNSPGATGDGIVMAQAVGAGTRDLEQIQLHPTVEQSTSMLITEGVRGDGAILVNQEGKRFTNEMLTRDAVSAAELEQTGCYAYVIFDQNLRDNLKAIQKYVDTNITVQADTIEGLAELIDIDPATLAETLAAWNECVANQEDPEFGRETGMEADLSVAPYYAIKIAPGIHHTMGGVTIDTEAEVLDTDSNVIPGLYAAGEVTGGVHGGNRLGGNAVADIVVFGNTAGTNAAAYVGAAAPADDAAEETEATSEAATEVAAADETGADVLTGSGDGFGGKVTATLTVAGGVITDCKLEAPDETPTIGGAALEELAAQVVAANGAEIDGVSGASLTTAGVKDAVAAALASTDKEAAGEAEALAFTAGTYTGKGDGYNGPVELAVTFSDTAVTGIEVVTSAETAHVGTPAYDIMFEDIIAANGSGIDGVSGATFTSRAVKAAVNDAAEQAGANLDVFKANTVVHEAQADIEETVDVVVVGAGGAGMGAAAQAAMNGETVLVLEENAEIGGNTLVSGGQFQATMPYLVWDAADPDATEAVWDYDGQTYAKVMSTQGNIDVLKVIAQWSEEPFNGDYFVENEYVAGEIDELSKQGVHEEYLPVLQALKAEIEEYLAWAQPKLDAGIPENEITLFSTDNLHIFQTYYGGLRQNADKTDWIYGDVELVTQFVQGGYELKTWLEDQGAKFADGDQLILIGALWYRENRQLGGDIDGDGEMEESGNWGAYFAPTVNTLLNTSSTAADNKIMTRTKAENLIVEDGKVTGVVATQYDGTKVTVHANKGVILATGGYAANIQLVQDTNAYWDTSYITDATKTTNRSSLVGDGIAMGEEAGAATTGTGWAQMMPISWIDNGNLAFGGGQYAAYINPTTGKRFVNESAERDVLSLGEFKNGVEVNGAQGVFLEFSNGDVPIGRPYPYDDYSTGVPVASHDQIDGRVYFVSSQEELQTVLDEFGMTADPATIYETLEAYDRAIMAGEQPEVGKAQASNLIGHADLDETDNYDPETYQLDGVLLRIRIMAPSTHHTMGGLAIDTDRHVLDADGNAIPGLYAAGEVTGGIHGGNRLGGNAIVEIFVSGRTAANAIAADYADAPAAEETSEAATEVAAADETAAAELTGSAAGFGGDVTATLKMNEDGTIAECVLEGPDETPTVGGAALEELAAQVVAANGAEIDGVSGASVTSEGVKAAVAAALASAGAEEAGEAEAAEATAFTPGTYTGTSVGFGGEVTVTLTVTEDDITEVEITGDKETVNIGTFAVELLDDEIEEANTCKVDALTGATVTSNAIKRAAADALTQAGADVNALPSAEKVEIATEDKATETIDKQIVIVGAGGAGMTAAIKAKQAGADVLIVEKMPYAGGNTTKATGGMNAAETHYQEEQGIEDSVGQFIQDTMTGGHDVNDMNLVTKMAEESAACIDWLDSIGAPLPKVAFSGGATNARIHAPEDGSGVGAYLVTAFLKQIDELGIEVMYNTKATEILMDGDKAVGIVAEGTDTVYTINADAVILATGGFGSNNEMIVSYREDLNGTVTTNTPGATGDGIVMAQAVGAGTRDLEQIQLHPTVEQSTSMLITESVRGNGAILVNQEGKRFTNEMLTRDAVSAAELEQTGSYAYVIFDQNLRDNLKAIEKYVETNITVQADTIEGLAEQIGIDPATLAETLAAWNECVANQADPEFGRDTAMDADLSVAPYYAIKIAPGIHHTMGGITINTDAEVLDTNGNVISGLYAAGEVTGGVHGANRIGGNAVADIVVFGSTAGASASEYVGLEAPAAEETAEAVTEAAEETTEAVTEATEETTEAVPEETAAADNDEIIPAATWAETYPELVETYNANGENNYRISYLEEDPYLVNVYEGYGFAKDYTSAVGHSYTLEDVANTERPHALANCLTCKTADFTKLVNDMGVEAYKYDFEETYAQMNESVGCYNCHANEAGNDGQLVITHDYTVERLGDSDIALEVLTCGQCHIEYYFDPETKQTICPYTSVEEMGPEAVLAYYDEIGFADWTQESTGTPMLKAQHPEMETFLSAGSVHAGMGMTCASCHMEKVTKEDGTEFSSHKWQSPLESSALLETCAACHKDTDMAEKVHAIQAEVTGREKEVGEKLSALKTALADEVAAGTRSEEELNEIRSAYRSAQWYWDYCYVENSEGAHNSTLAKQCLDKSEEIIDTAMNTYSLAAAN